MDDPTIAVVVPTYRRPESLERCLDAIAAQTVAPERIVVVVRRGDSETAAALPRLHAKLPFETATVAQSGVVAAMDAGVALCEEEVVAVTDDDATPHVDWLETLRSRYGPGIGGVGGRDLVEHPSHLARRPDPVVGRLTWFGRLHGNHHLGVGDVREVDVLKGVNMSLRRELWETDRRLRGDGAQVHWEIGMCLSAKGRGWRLLYDPSARVDHFPGPRHDADDRARQTLGARFDSEWNYAYALGRHLPVWRLPVAAMYLVGVGTRGAPGVVAYAASVRRQGRPVGTARPFALTRTRISALAAGIRNRR